MPARLRELRCACNSPPRKHILIDVNATKVSRRVAFLRICPPAAARYYIHYSIARGRLASCCLLLTMVLMGRAPTAPALLVLVLLSVLLAHAAALDNGLGRRPVMGWNRCAPTVMSAPTHACVLTLATTWT